MCKKILMGAAVIGALCMGLKSLKKENKIPLIGQDAPSFSAQSTKGIINFPLDFLGKWTVFFSHPADFTPVCTTEFMTFQNSADKFAQINTQLVGLSVDDIVSHRNWLSSIKNKVKFNGMENIEVEFPLIADPDGSIAKKYGMLQADSTSTKTVRAVFIIDPEGKIRAILYYPQSTGRNIPEILRMVTALQTSDIFNVATPANWTPGEDIIIPPDKKPYELSSDELKELRITCHDWFLCTRPLSKDDINKIIKNSEE